MSDQMDLLREAIRSRHPAVLSAPMPKPTHEVPLRLLADAHSEGFDALWAEVTAGQVEALEELIAASSSGQVQFITGEMQVSFATAPLTVRRSLLRSPRVLLDWPASVRVTERRRGARETVLDDIGVRVRIEEPARLNCVAMTLYDLSPTGAGLLCDGGPMPLQLKPGEELRVRISVGESDHTIAARHCHTRTLPSGSALVGLAFLAGHELDERSNPALFAAIELLRDRRISRSMGSNLGSRAP